MRVAFVRVAALGMLLLTACTESGQEPITISSSAANPAATVAPVPDWSTQLVILLPAIEACLGAVQGAVGVTKAWTVETRFGGARVVTATKSRVDCIASKDGAMVLLTEAVPASSQLAGEQEPLFTPAAAPPPRTGCYETRDAVDAGGTRIGWLSYETCRHPKRLPLAARTPKPARPDES